ncbi:MAG TPA: NfeD family protein [Legionella sp.]|nr:NfeD family protein [Legionella sp.]
MQKTQFMRVALNSIRHFLSGYVTGILFLIFCLLPDVHAAQIVTAVNESTSMTATEPLKLKENNYIAINEQNLPNQMNGVSVKQNDHQTKGNTTHPIVTEMNPDWRARFLSIITNPTVAYFLIMLGIYGLFVELINPGMVLPGAVGVVSLLLALYALHLLPVNYAGLGLIVIGVGFIIAEALTPSFGVLGTGGTVAFILGSILLINSDLAAYQISWPVILVMAVINVIFFIILINLAIRSRNQKVKNGLVMLLGAKGRTLNEVNLEGQAIIRGEIWSVHSKTPISADKNIKVILANGLKLEVEEDLNQE